LSAKNDYDAKKYYREFLKYASEEQVLYYPKEQLYFTFADSFSREIATHRLNVMRAAIDGKKQIIVTSIWALAERRLFAGAAHKKTFHAGDTLEMETLVRLLVNYGYVREERTEAPGQFTVRGGIIDYYDATQKHPVRVEFYGDEIDSVRTFDPDSQLSLEKAESFTVFPFDDQILSESEILAAIGRMRKEAEQSIPKVKNETLREEMSRNSTELLQKWKTARMKRRISFTCMRKKNCPAFWISSKKRPLFWKNRRI
jgi:transcription-repair coupling factor (superfamily II helicase)